MVAAAPDEEVAVDNSAGGAAALSWRRPGGVRVTCALEDVLAVSASGSTLHVAHYPLAQARAAHFWGPCVLRGGADAHRRAHAGDRLSVMPSRYAPPRAAADTLR